MMNKEVFNKAKLTKKQRLILMTEEEREEYFREKEALKEQKKEAAREKKNAYNRQYAKFHRENMTQEQREVAREKSKIASQERRKVGKEFRLYVSFIEDLEMYNWLEEQENVRTYLYNLVKEDMKKHLED